jgi:hypothetical protein
MGYGGVWVITGMGYDRFDCIRSGIERGIACRSNQPAEIVTSILGPSWG